MPTLPANKIVLQATPDILVNVEVPQIVAVDAEDPQIIVVTTGIISSGGGGGTGPRGPAGPAGPPGEVYEQLEDPMTTTLGALWIVQEPI